LPAAAVAPAIRNNATEGEMPKLPFTRDDESKRH
jgi:hypothetical protein